MDIRSFMMLSLGYMIAGHNLDYIHCFLPLVFVSRSLRFSLPIIFVDIYSWWQWYFEFFWSFVFLCYPYWHHNVVISLCHHPLSVSMHIRFYLWLLLSVSCSKCVRLTMPLIVCLQESMVMLSLLTCKLLGNLIC